MSQERKPRILFLGLLYPMEEEERILEMTLQHPSNAPNVFQWNLIRGMEQALGSRMEIMNVLPVGTWPKACKHFTLPDRTWPNGDALCHEVGCINLPFLKQGMRAARAARLLKKLLRPGDQVVLYSAYMPFLKALARLPRTITVHVIIPDLPEFYDLGATSALRKCLRKLQNRMIYRCMKRIDRFVLLTEHMHEPLKVGDRPWMLLEGICSAQPPAPAQEEPQRAILYAGTLHRQFGIQNLLNAFAMLPDPDAQLWLCGSGDAEGDIRILCEKDPRVTFFGFVSLEEVARLRSRAAVLVNPRTGEGEYTRYSFPSKTMEYMASGKPVVMYRLAGIPAEYDPFLYYVPEDTPESLCRTLSYVLSHPEDAAQVASRAQAYVLENKTPAIQGQRLVDFITGKA